MLVAGLPAKSFNAQPKASAILSMGAGAFGLVLNEMSTRAGD